MTALPAQATRALDWGLRLCRQTASLLQAPLTVRPSRDLARRRARSHVALVGAGPGAADLLSLRALARIRAADVLLYDRLVDPEVIALARRGCRTIYVGKEVGAHAWPQHRIDACIVAEALKGQRVVRLKSGDPGIFGRLTEELTAARLAGLPVEVVPGITAACAAAAHQQISLTERGVADTLILTTGTCQHGSALPDSTRHAGPGTTSVFYMSVRQASRVRDGLISQGLPRRAAVRIAADVAKAGEQHLACRLDQLPDTLRAAAITGCALIIVTWPKPARQPDPALGRRHPAQGQPAPG